MNPGEQIVFEFQRLVQRDGGLLTLRSFDGSAMTIEYRAGQAAHCDSNQCVLPHLELEELINETVQRRYPDCKVIIVNKLAWEQGFEPWQRVLETLVLPLHHTHVYSL